MDNAMRVSDLIENADEGIVRVLGTIRTVTALADSNNELLDTRDMVNYLDTLDEALGQVHRDMGKAGRALARLRHGTGPGRHRKANGTQRRLGLALVKGAETPAAH